MADAGPRARLQPKAALSSRPLGADTACRARTAGLAARPRRVPGGGGATRPGFGAVSPGHATPAKVRSLRGPPIWSSRPFAIDTGRAWMGLENVSVPVAGFRSVRPPVRPRPGPDTRAPRLQPCDAPSAATSQCLKPMKP